MQVRKVLLLVIGMLAGLGVRWTMLGKGLEAPVAYAQTIKQGSDPLYDSSGALVRPQNFETWVFVGSSTGLTYEPGLRDKSPGEFHDVYIRPESFREYQRTGKFPEKTVLVLALYAPDEKVSPAKGGYFEGELDGMAAAVKDHSRFPEGWAYFNFGEAGALKDKASANPKETCFACHKQHAADDNVFVQFYPILRPIMKAHAGASAK